MNYEPVDVFVVDESNVPVDGVLVRVYSTDGKRVLGENITDSGGVAAFLLPGPAEYDARFYKFAAGFRQPLRLDVQSDAATPGKTPNAFEVQANTFLHPQATDPRLSRASGYFRDVTGASRRQLDIHFILYSPFLLEGSAVMGERVSLKTDDQGFGCIDLVRCAVYKVTIESWEDHPRTIRVPDTPSVNLPDLLFAVVDRVELTVPSLSVGAEVALELVVFDSAGVPLSGSAMSDVQWSVADPSIVELSVTQDSVSVRGLTRGTTELLAERKDSSIVRIPATPIQGVPVSVVVA